jgi:hypothetical protein
LPDFSFQYFLLVLMFSIITVTRNGARTIADCLASVAAQSVRPEHVIVDGASTDASVVTEQRWDIFRTVGCGTGDSCRNR